MQMDAVRAAFQKVTVGMNGMIGTEDFHWTTFKQAMTWTSRRVPDSLVRHVDV